MAARRVPAQVARPRDRLDQQPQRAVAQLPPAARGDQPDRGGRVRDRGLVHAQVQAPGAGTPEATTARVPERAPVTDTAASRASYVPADGVADRTLNLSKTYARDMPYQCRWRSRQDAFRVDGVADSSTPGQTSPDAISAWKTSGFATHNAFHGTK